MDIFSYAFFILWIMGILLYYSIAKGKQWIVLLTLSLIFYGYALTNVPIVLIVVCILTYAAAIYIADVDKAPELLSGKKIGGGKMGHFMYLHRAISCQLCN